MTWWERFKSLFVKNDEADNGFEEIYADYSKIYLKSLAIDKSAEFLARIFSKSDFRYLIKDSEVKNEWSYMLNIRPNFDDSATRFWQRFVYKLITDNEVLVIKTDDDQFLIADSYIRKEYTVYEDLFESVVVKDYTFKRKFAMNEVIFLEYNNNRLNSYLDNLFNDYYSLYERMLEVLARNNQIRGVLKVRGATQFNKEQTEKLKTYSDRLFKAFSNRSVAIIPTMDNVEYQELTNTAGTGNISVDELQKLKRQFDDEVADILGIPNAILHGDMATLDSSQQALVNYCLEPLVSKIQDELNAKVVDKSDFINGHEIKIVGQTNHSIFDLASSIDKLISSGTFNRNEVRKELNYAPIPGGDEFIMTKNYDIYGKGGEVENGEIAN